MSPRLIAGAGKTTRLLQWLREAPQGELRVLVSFSEQESRRVQKIGVDEWDLKPWQFIAANQAHRLGSVLWLPLRLDNPPSNIVLGVDNAELVLGILLHQPVKALSVTPRVA